MARALPGLVPEGLRPFEAAPPDERKRRALRVLLEARKKYRERFGTLEECLSDGTLESWWAKQILRSYVACLDLTQWEREQHQPRCTVYRTLDACIRVCRQQHGGWFVSPRAVR